MDLNVCIEVMGIRDPDDVIREKLKRCKQLGFGTIALSVHIDITHLKEKSKQQLTIPEPPKNDVTIFPGLKVYTRLTVKVSETIQLFRLSKSEQTAKFNLLALEPDNDKLFQYIMAGQVELDIITFDLSDRLNFNLFKAKFKLLQGRGVCFEINYGPAQLGSSIRRNIICNAQNLVEKTSHNLILSSGVQDIFRLRGPKDAESLGVLFMIPFKKCHDIVYKNGMKAITSAKHRTNQVSSAIELIT